MFASSRSGFVRHLACESLERRLFLNAGDLDTSFSADGKATIDAGGGTEIHARDVAVQSGGRVVLVGEVFYGGPLLEHKLVLARYAADGTLDTSFGGSGTGLASTDFSDINSIYGHVHTGAIAVQPDDRIVVVGWVAIGSTGHFFTARFTADGVLDSTFSGDGKDVNEDFDSGDLYTFGHAVVIQLDGKIVVAGTSVENASGAQGDMAVARYNADGTLDSSFGGNGEVEIGFGQNESAIGMTIDSSGKIILVGDQYPSSNVSDHRIAVARLNTNGSLDTSFSGDGRYAAQYGAGSTWSGADSVVVQPGGKIVIAGEFGLSDFATHNFAVTRLTSSGTIDTTFGPSGNGIVDIDFTGGADGAGDVIIDQSGHLIVGGGGAGDQMDIACLTSEGILDPVFSIDGKQTVSFGTEINASAGALAVAPGGTFVAAGGTHLATARLFARKPATTSIGSLDPNASEPGTNFASFFVTRLESLPTVTRVFLNVGGTARPPNRFPLGSNDYTGTNISFGNGVSTSTYVDIAPNETFTSVIITPVDDSTVEGDETAVFTIAGSQAYDVGTNPSTTLVVRDNDILSGPVVTTSAFVYDSSSPQRLTFRFNQDVSNSIGAGDFEVTGPAGVVPFTFVHDSVTNTSTLSFASILPDANYTARVIAAGVTNVGGTPMPADHILPFFVLAGDADRDRHVNDTDSAIVAANLGQTGRTFPQGDFNYDGAVNASDEAILNANWHAWLPAPGALPLPATAGDDAYLLRRGSATLLDLFVGGAAQPTHRVIMSTVTSISFVGGAGNNSLTIDRASGDPLPTGVFLDFNGAGSATDTLHLIGTAGATDSATFWVFSAYLGTSEVKLSDIEAFTFDGKGGGAGDNLIVNFGRVSLAATQTLGSLTIAFDATLDVGDHDLILDYSSVSPVGVWTGSTYDGVSGMIKSGTLTSSLGSGNLKTLGVAEAREALGITGTQTGTFAGESVDSTAVLVKFTWGGDANLDGRINIDDYGRIDGNVAQSGVVFGWFNGDFNLDGKINIDDYGIIDGNINQQDDVL